MRALPGLVLIALLVLLAGCSTAPDKPGAIGEAYVAPLTLNLRAEISPAAKTVASLKHGDHLEILQTRRRFVKVRTASGVEGWTDTRQLLSTEQMEGLKEFSAESAALPSMGKATVYGTLNMHSEPNRTSPSFYQIKEGTAVEVVGHVVTDRVQNTITPATKLVKPPPPKPRKKKPVKESTGIPPPPKGPPPKPPENWLEMSRKGLDPDDVEEKETKAAAEKADAKKKKPEAPAPPVRKDDWSLVRTADGKAGWVLTRMLNMAIPDEVAQYAEGARISSYFSLGTVQDEDAVKHHWLWTTIRGAAKPFDFDSFRVFIYNARKHRYETAYIERNVVGYYPVEAQAGSSPSFKLILEDDDGVTWRKTFAFEGYRVRVTNVEPWKRSTLPAAQPTVSSATQTANAPPQGAGSGQVPDAGVTEKTKKSITERIKGLFLKK